MFDFVLRRELMPRRRFGPAAGIAAVFYTGAAPNQQAIPAVEYLMSKDGGAAKRWVLLGTDYVYPRTTNKILRAFLHSKGVQDKDIEEVYTPFGHSDYQTIVANI